MFGFINRIDNVICSPQSDSSAALESLYVGVITLSTMLKTDLKTKHECSYTLTLTCFGA